MKPAKRMVRAKAIMQTLPTFLPLSHIQQEPNYPGRKWGTLQCSVMEKIDASPV